ncbi:MAG: DUF2610 domain-containing protein [Acidobacteriota bacterium]
MRRFTVPCDFGGTTSPFDVYISGGEPLEGYHPLHFQSLWLREERGGEIPQEVMDSFAKLLELARKNGVDFEELCVHAMQEAEKEKAAKGDEST